MAERVSKDRLLETKELTVTVNVVLVEYLTQLVQKGTYGTHPGTAAHMLLSNAIEGMVQAGSLKEIPYGDSHKPAKDGKPEVSDEG